MEDITVQVPKKLAEFIDKLIADGYFTSKEDFIRCSSEILAELYGLSQTVKGGKSLLDVLADNTKGTAPAKPKIAEQIKPSQTQAAIVTQATIPSIKDSSTSQELDILDLFAGVKYEFEDALHARYTMELMKMAKAPVPKEEFIAVLENLAKKGKIERSEHNNKIIWKILDRY